MQNQSFCVVDTMLITENYMSIYPPNFSKEVRLFVDEAKKNRDPSGLRLIDLTCPAGLIHPSTAIHINRFAGNKVC